MSFRDVTAGADIQSYVAADAVSEHDACTIKWVCGEGIVSGKPGNRIDSTGTAIRAEVAPMRLHTKHHRL